VLTLEIALSRHEVSSNRYRAFPLQESDHFRNRVFWRYRNEHVDVILHEVPFHDLALMLSRQIVEDCAKLPSKFSINGFLSVLGDKDYVVFALPAGVI
jgi:hypothetical protein